MKVFCIGLSRTGTTSLCEALKLMNFKTLHFSLGLFIHPEIISKNLKFEPRLNVGLFQSWRRQKEIKAINKNFDYNILSKFEVFGDLPIPLFYKELDKLFPNSKFIYTYRNSDRWLKSMKWLYNEGAVLWSHGLLDDEIKFRAYNTTVYNKHKLINSFNNHHQEVVSYFKNRTDDILMINIDEEVLNFRILGKFLNADVPVESKFPKSNIKRKASRKKHLKFFVSKYFPLITLLYFYIKKNLSKITNIL